MSKIILLDTLLETDQILRSENVIGVETFQPSGRCADTGRVFYRVGTEMP